MAGHSHWANISAKKAVIGKNRGKLWSKLVRAIIVAAQAVQNVSANFNISDDAMTQINLG